MDTEATRNLTRFNSVIEAYNPYNPLRVRGILILNFSRNSYSINGLLISSRRNTQQTPSIDPLLAVIFKSLPIYKTPLVQKVYFPYLEQFPNNCWQYAWLICCFLNSHCDWLRNLASLFFLWIANRASLRKNVSFDVIRTPVSQSTDNQISDNTSFCQRLSSVSIVN